MVKYTTCIRFTYLIDLASISDGEEYCFFGCHLVAIAVLNTKIKSMCLSTVIVN